MTTGITCPKAYGITGDKMLEFVKRTRLPASATDVFDWHLRPGAFERLNPAWEPVQIVSRGEGVAEGSRVELQIPVGPLKMSWISEHRGIVPGKQFQDIQVRGPFGAFEHTHRMISDGPGSCVLEDQIHYRLPFGPFGVLGKRLVQQKLQRMFDYRHRLMVDDFQAILSTSTGKKTMNILVSGATGLVGSALCALLTTSGHAVTKLVRKPTSDGKSILWNGVDSNWPSERIEEFDAVIHLAGDNIAKGRWTPVKKKRIKESRTQTTRLLATAMANAKKKPSVFLCASAIGFYGDRGDEICTENSIRGQGFLPDVCSEWEAATRPAVDAGIRVVNMRIGVVLSPAGGALHSMLTPFKLGLGGRLGNGRQFMSTIALDDVIGAIHHCLITPELSGPVNLVSPDAVPNYQFTKTLGKVLNRPTIFPAPGFVLKIALGQMADELLLSSTRVRPDRLMETGYKFRYPTVEGSLRHVLGLMG